MALEWSTEFSEIVKALPVAQSAIGKVVKDSKNDHLGNKYASLAAVIDAVIPAMNTNGITVMQPVEYDGQVVTVQTLLIHTSGQFMRTTLSMRPVKTDPQGVGSAITYARRYALLAIAGVAPEDDDGAAASQAPKNSAVGQDGGQSQSGVLLMPDGWERDWRVFAQDIARKYRSAESHEDLAAIDAAHAEELCLMEEQAEKTNAWLVEQFKERLSQISEEKNKNRSEAA